MLRTAQRSVLSGLLCTPIILIFYMVSPPAFAAEAEGGDLQPNIVLIVMDDMGWGDAGAYGGSFVQTPEMDALAAEGMILTQHYANAALCSPTRAALLSGHYPQQHGIRRVIPMNSHRGLPPELTTLPEMLRGEGYATGHFGKWHLGQQRDEYLPLAQGYDEAATLLLTDPQTHVDPLFRINGNPPAQVIGHATRIITDHVLAFIDDHQAGPFFATVWYSAAHTPHQPPPEWASQYSDNLNGRYAAAISDADEKIGEIVDAIDGLGLGAQTLILLTSDNGSSRVPINANGPYRGSKGDLYEGGIRTPLFARWPGTIGAGVANDSPSTTFDWFPTIAALLGADVSALRLEGQSLLPALLDDQQVERSHPLFWESKEQTEIFTSLDGEWNRYAVRKGNWKLVRQDNTVNDRPALFDIALDPAETTDLASTHPDVVDELMADFGAWRDRVSDIPDVVESTVGGVKGSYRFRNGRVELVRDVRFDFNDGDFSFQAEILPFRRGGSNQVVAELPGSWRLSVLNLDTLQLEVHGPSASTTLTAPLPGGSVHVAFTVFGWRFSPSTIRLYVAGELEAETNEVAEVLPNQGSIYLGNSETMDGRYRGRITELRLHAQSLKPDEVRVGAECEISFRSHPPSWGGAWLEWFRWYWPLARYNACH